MAQIPIYFHLWVREMGAKILEADGVYLDPERTHSQAYSPQVKEMLKWASFLISPFSKYRKS